jgi:regulator of sirC expression with transglutaminase-like and TPR domain
MITNNTNKELSALVSLIDEPNEEIFHSIRTKIAGYGTEAIPLLEDAWLNVLNEEYSRRIEELIDEIRLDDLYFELVNWSNFYSNDLIKVFMILSKYRYPDLDEDKYREKFDKLRRDVWLEINDHLTALEKVKVLNHIFYDIHHFRGMRQQKENIQAFCINEVMDSHRGNAISLGILYIAIAQKLNIPVFGVDLLKHFILVYMDDSITIKVAEKYTEDDVLFYINALNKGAVFTKREIKQYINQMDIQSKEEYFLPGTNIVLVKRFIEEMSSAYAQDKQFKKAEEVIGLLKALD